MNSVRQKCFTSLVLAGLLSACSGGGGGSDDNPAPGGSAPDASPVVISSTNASKVSAEAYNATISTRSLGANGLGGVGITAAVVVPREEKFDLFEFLRAQIFMFPRLGYQVAGDLVSSVAVSASTADCEGGGTITISGEVADPLTITAGDLLNIELNNCSDASGELNGHLSVRFNSISEDQSGQATDFNVTLTMTDFTVNQFGATSSGDGDMTLGIRSLSATEVEASLSGTSLTIVEGGTTGTITNFSIIETLNEATGASTTTSSGTLASTEIGGSLNFETTTPFQSLANEFPFAGTLVVTGANGSSLQFVVIDSVDVRLDIDADGDGSFEESVASTWAELESL